MGRTRLVGHSLRWVEKTVDPAFPTLSMHPLAMDLTTKCLCGLLGLGPNFQRQYAVYFATAIIFNHS